jgi:hypothetical protein
MKDDKTSLTKTEKDRIKNSYPTGTYTDQEWAILQGMIHSDFNRKSSVGSFLDETEKIKLKNN